MSDNMIIIWIVVIAATVGITSAYYLGDDNPVEEAAEFIIDVETGKKIDLTPRSKETQ